MRFPLKAVLAVVGVAVLTGAIVFDAAIRASLAQYNGPVVTQPSYGPGGREVAFRTDWREKPEIWAVSTLDGRLRPIVDGIEPTWSPTGSWIAFVSSRAGNFNLWLVRPDGSGLTQLTQSTTSRSRHILPAWLPDGKQIAFVADGIWAINVDGSGLRRMINPDPQRARGRPSFSPDGKQIVLSEEVCSKMGAGYICTGDRLVIMNTDGTGARYLTSEGFKDVDPNWGRRGILFFSNRFGSSGIKLIQPDGTGLQAIPNADGIKPTWAPDGNRFAFRGGGGIYEFHFLDGAIRTLVEITGFFIPIDIMPSVSPKIVSVRETTLIPVAILSAPGFDPVNELDQTSLTFGGTGDEESLDSCRVDGGNMVCQFKTALTGFRAGDMTGILRATKLNGKPLEGRVSVQIVP